MKVVCLLLVVGLVLGLTDRSSSFLWRKRRGFNPCRVIACDYHKTREITRDDNAVIDVNNVKDGVSRDVQELPEADQSV